MRIQVASDLHLEHLQRKFPGERIVRPSAADVLILAGDIHNGTRAIEMFRDWPTPIIYVLGNHEFYDGHRERTLAEFRDAVRGTNITMLENETIVYRGTRFIGCTLWTSFTLEGCVESELMSEAAQCLADFRAIETEAGRLTPMITVGFHQVSRAFLESALATPFDGPTVVVTHHGPHPLSIHEKFKGNPLNAAFITNLQPLMGVAKLWIHGHVHDSFDYTVAGTRVVANPRGYPRGRSGALSINDVSWENPSFDAALVVMV